LEKRHSLKHIKRSSWPAGRRKESPARGTSKISHTTEEKARETMWPTERQTEKRERKKCRPVLRDQTERFKN